MLCVYNTSWFKDAYSQSPDYRAIKASDMKFDKNGKFLNQSNITNPSALKRKKIKHFMNSKLPYIRSKAGSVNKSKIVGNNRFPALKAGIFSKAELSKLSKISLFYFSHRFRRSIK